MSNRPRSLFLFDIDGTLLTAGTAIHRDAFAHAFRSVYGVALDLEGISAAGRTDYWLLAEPLRRLGWSDGQIAEGISDAFREMEAYTDEHPRDLRHCVLDGVPEVLEGIHERGELVGLLTGNLSGIAMAKLRHAGLARYFDTGGFGEESEVRADLVPVALEKAGELAGQPIPPERAIVVGDTPLDIEAGQVHGTKAVGVATGPFTVEQLTSAGPDLVLESFAKSKEAVGALIQLAATSHEP